ncbi:hypothetical protein Cs7R123_46810 [Catellatospora sp. TT07R-123]|uniref:PQQ-binding-like beta-propeller repeat protein n=1 Tax=Catellatospora sp. TT07R-123 TaxID=2733863 RepID=UPI001B1F54FE|nr:PQQ-binding-like beta-propeller repeat protein [Catellatospora sp. TT07R-123]GHJ47339.1 hypothetical protein Cs7R123_46810 [Catellatospora sp. TT07R-123]
MTSALRIDRVLGDRPFAEIGEPALAVADESRGLLAVAGTDKFGTAPVGVYGIGDLGCRAILRSGHPVHAMAFHPTSPLLAVGTGGYDGGYFFEGELLLMDLETGAGVSLIEDPLGRQVLALEWLTGQELRVLMAPPDDWQDKQAWTDGHVAVVRRRDWRVVPPRSITGDELAGPRVAAPRLDGREDARRAVSGLSADWDPRRDVRGVEELSDGRIVATLDGAQAESWLPSGERQGIVPDDMGGRDLVVAADERSVWVCLMRPEWEERPQPLVRLSAEDGMQLEQLTSAAPASLVRCGDGLPAVAPAGEGGRLRIRRGSRIYVRQIDREREWTPGPAEAWLAAADLQDPATDGHPREPAEQDFRRLSPYSWTPGETHFAGPGAEIADGSLVHAGTVHHGQGLQPGGSFVVRRTVTDGQPRWIFRTDRKATDLDADANTAYVAYEDGEIVALDLHDGAVRWREQLAVAGVPAIPTALTVAGPGRLLVGTSDGRILDCSVG